MWYILKSVTSLVFSSRLSLPSSVSSTNNSNVLDLVKHVESIKSLMSTTLTTAYHILVKKFSTEVIHPDVSDLPGLLLLVVLAVHSAADHQTI